MKSKKWGIKLGVVCLITSVQAANQYGPTTDQENLWQIAARTRPSDAISTQQMMLALREKNPNAFTEPNINALKKGSYLTIPDIDEIIDWDKRQALHTSQQQNQQWQANTVANAGRITKTSAKPSRTKTNVSLAQIQRSQQQMQQEIHAMRQQLQQEQAQTQQLIERIKLLQTSQNNANNTQTPNYQKLHTEIDQLKSVLAEKDAHIQNLQASLREASATIKRQYTENQALHAALPANAESTTALITKPSLSLQAVPEAAPKPQNTVPNASLDKPIVFKDQLPSASNDLPNPKVDSPKNGVPLSNLISQQAAEAEAAGLIEIKQPPITPSRISILVALASLFFIIGLVWRAVLQRRYTHASALKRVK
jgi:FimV-like protein